MTYSTVFPLVTGVRTTIETYVLDLYESDGTTLKPLEAWPGYYSLPNGTRIPATFVTGAHMVPSNWTVTGIECTIDDVPEIVDQGTSSGLVQIEYWNVRFTNYGINKGTKMSTSMLDIRRRLARVFPNDRVVYMARTEATFEAITARISGAVLNPPIP